MGRRSSVCQDFVHVRAAAEQKSFFKSAENRPARRVSIGGHRYKGILCASKLVWVYSDFKLDHHLAY